MPPSEHRHGDERHEEFILRVFPDGVVDLAACWDQTNVRRIAKDLRQIADGLDLLPPDHSGQGVQPL